MKIHANLQQKSFAWLTARAGKVTGSELGNLITDKGAIRKWDTAMPNSYLHRKLAEKWRGCALESFMGSRQTDQGSLYEERARNYFASLLDADIQQIGGIESDDGKLWCSPDGIIGEEVGLEIKCPNADTHCGWLLRGGIPEEHALQVQFSLYVSGWGMWNFLAFCRDFPHLVVHIEPNGELLEIIGEALTQFFNRFDSAWSKLCEINGGPPPPPKQFVSQEPVKFSWEQDENCDIIP